MMEEFIEKDAKRAATSAHPPPERPLRGLLVLDLSQFLSGPYCSLRLADLGARVIKVERAGKGDLSRQLYLSDTEFGGDSTIFHAINRGKESLALDLKDPADLEALRNLAGKADVMIQNFRPGVADRIGVGWEAMRALNPRLVYGSISGYGTDGPWVRLPGQDLLAQARSGLMWLTGDATQGPVPMGLAVGDMFAGVALCQGILAALVRRGIDGRGCHVETSLLESLVDLQFEVLTTWLNDGRRLPQRSQFNGAHAYLGAPYGVYAASDGYLAIAMTPLDRLAELMNVPELAGRDPGDAFEDRDTIKASIAKRVAEKTVEDWLAVLQPADVWCSEVLNWSELMDSEAFRRLGLLQTVTREDGVSISTTRAPLTIDGRRPTGTRAAPTVGEHSRAIRREFGL